MADTNRTLLPLPSVLTVIFVIAKLTHNIDWSWWWVFSPLWISSGLVLLVLAVVLGTAFVLTLRD